MKKMLEEKTDMVRLRNALFPSITTLNTSKTFDTPLIANLGEKVFFLKLELEFLDNGEEVVKTSIDNIIKGTVCRINCATGSATCLTIKEDDSGEEHGSVQELFFRSFEEAVVGAINVNRYTETHSSWKGKWYEIYKRLIKPVYRYILRFPLVPLQTQKVLERDSWHYNIPKWVIANIGEKETIIHCLGKDTKAGHILGGFKMCEMNYYPEYELIPFDESD